MPSKQVVAGSNLVPRPKSQHQRSSTIRRPERVGLGTTLSLCAPLAGNAVSLVSAVSPGDRSRLLGACHLVSLRVIVVSVVSHSRAPGSRRRSLADETDDPSGGAVASATVSDASLSAAHCLAASAATDAARALVLTLILLHCPPRGLRRSRGTDTKRLAHAGTPTPTAGVESA